MENLIARFLESSHIDPVYFVTCIVDIIALILWRRLKRGLSVLERSLYTAIILVAIVLTAGALCRLFGIIKDWKEFESIWSL